jgi:hypothetical protein
MPRICRFRDNYRAQSFGLGSALPSYFVHRLVNKCSFLGLNTIISYFWISRKAGLPWQSAGWKPAPPWALARLMPIPLWPALERTRRCGPSRGGGGKLPQERKSLECSYTALHYHAYALELQAQYSQIDHFFSNHLNAKAFGIRKPGLFVFAAGFRGFSVIIHPITLMACTNETQARLWTCRRYAD